MPLPEKWSLVDFITWSARLGGASKSSAEVGAHQALSRLDLRDDAKTPLAKCPAHVRALAPLAAAIATRAPLVLFEDPTFALPADLARGVARKIVASLEGRQWILFAGQIALDSPFALHADEAIVIGGSKAAQGAVAEVAAREGTYAVRIHGEARTFAKLVASRGGASKGDGEDLLIELGEKLRTRDLFDLAEQAHSVIVELRPLSRAFV
jgi:ABC-type multidrug transport system ATPase subunit